MEIKEIKSIFDKAIISYCKKEIGIGDLEKRVSILATFEVLSSLSNANENELFAVIEQVSDATYYLNQETFNHHDPGNILSIIDTYCQSIKNR